MVKFTDQDYSLYHQVLSCDKVMANITGGAIDEHHIKQAFERVLSTNSLHEDFGFFKIYANHEYVGYAKFTLTESKKHRMAEVGYFLLPQFWGKGVASLTIETLIERAKNQALDLCATVNKQNTISKHLLAKYGFVYQYDDVVDNLMGEYWQLPLTSLIVK